MSRAYYPEEWGILVPREGKAKPPTFEDLCFLEEARVIFEACAGEPISYRDLTAEWFDEMPGPHNWLSKSLNRLWMAGYIEKFATMLHTQSGRPEYISWYIWGVKIEPKPEVPQFTYMEDDE